MSLQETINATWLAIENGTFQTGRKRGLWATICRIWDNLFNHRTRSRFVEGAILAQKDFALVTRIPEDMILRIFALCKSDLPALASVNWSWKRLMESEKFYTSMFSPEFANLGFGKKDLKTYFDIDLGEREDVPRLPLKAYGDIEKGICLLSYFPKVIPIANENGVIENVAPRAKIIGELVKNPKPGGHPTGFHKDSCFTLINQDRAIEGGKWTLTYKNPPEFPRAFNMKRTFDYYYKKCAHVVEFDKAVYAGFMHYVKTAEHCFTNHPEDSQFKVVETKGSLPIINAPNASIQVSFLYFQ